MFSSLGFELDRTKGDHMILRKKDHPYRIVIPKWKEIPVFIIKSNIDSAGITREEYLKLVKKFS